MSRKIKRKGTSVRRTAAAQGKARKVRQARASTGSALDAVMDWLPISEAGLQRVFMAAILGGAVALAWIAASMAGLPTLAGKQLAAVASDAGFQVRRVDVRGVENLNELKVYEAALAQRDQPMPSVDVAALRDRLLELSWVKDARVSRQLPDTLVIDIVERQPHAVLRKQDRLVLIDETGHELEPISVGQARGKLMVSGPGAARQMKDLAALLEAAPALKPQVQEAQWIGNRRWDLKFKTDQVLALPEGGKNAAAALVSFARLDGTNRLIGGKVAAFDMRAGDRIYLLIPGRGNQSAAINSASVARQQEAP
jgi:cell division protein FtsQ